MEQIKKEEDEATKVVDTHRDIYTKYENEVIHDCMTYEVVDIESPFLNRDGVVTVTLKIPDEVLNRRKLELEHESELSSIVRKKYRSQLEAIREWRDATLRVMGKKNITKPIPELPAFCEHYFE